MAAFVLDLGHQDRLALQRRRAGDPVALGQHADDLRMRVLRYLPDQRFAVGLGHPVLGLDLDVGVDARLERALVVRHVRRSAHRLDTGFHHLRVHRSSAFPFRLGPGPSERSLDGTGLDRPKTIHFSTNRRKYCITSRRFSSERRRPPIMPTSARSATSRPGARPAHPALDQAPACARVPPRAPSLIVTVWGDAIAPHGGAVVLPGLIRLLDPFGINERLVRTNVFRLARQGWLRPNRWAGAVSIR